MNSFSKILKSGKGLTTVEAYNMQTEILMGRIGTSELINIFSLMDGRFPTIEEMKGIIAATRDSMVPVKIHSEALDLVGTGGDGMKTFNISTAAAIVCAASGIPMAKHGNRSATSRCGSADVLEALGVNITLTADKAVSCFEKTGFVFFFAPAFHPSLKNAAEARKQFGKRTYFNILGPLVNPARASHITLGVFDLSISSLMGKASLGGGVQRAWVVKSPDGLDELSPFSVPEVISFSEHSPDGETISINYKPVKGSHADLQVEDVKQSAAVINAVLNNDASPIQTETVIINAAAGIMTFGKTNDFGKALELAMEAIKSGKAKKKLEQIRKASNE